MPRALTLALLASLALSACTPVVVGGAAYVIADQVMEQDGDDGLF
ncbi:hypothetical protein [Ovoidimarina sediminis]|nr:hypothetical protein [Rhodophyticola sp. MJ-SS7]MDU8942806.1 hypothetical protein [Rhodophyticola sp. MJ-SS7]